MNTHVHFPFNERMVLVAVESIDSRNGSLREYTQSWPLLYDIGEAAGRQRGTLYAEYPRPHGQRRR